MQFCIKVVVKTNTQIIFSKYATNLKNDNIPQEPENLRFVHIVILFYFYFAFLNDIIDSPYSPYYVTRTSANGSAVNWSRDFRLF